MLKIKSSPSSAQQVYSLPALRNMRVLSKRDDLEVLRLLSDRLILPNHVFNDSGKAEA